MNGKAWLARLGAAGRVRARHGEAGEAGPGRARRGKAWLAWFLFTLFLPTNRSLRMSDNCVTKWKNGFRGASILSASQTQKELEKIRKKNKGELDPQLVVNTVNANKQHKLRSFFNWNDSEAANLHRVEQARNMIRSIVVVRSETPKYESREYQVGRSKITPQKQTYTTVDEILKDPDSRGELLQRALGELLALQRRYRGLQELAIVFRSIDEVLTDIHV